MLKINREVVAVATFIMLSSHSFAGHPIVHLGGFNSSQGQSQKVDILNTIGDQYTLNKHYDTNWLFGLGYYFDWPINDALKVMYGIDAYYLAKNEVNGTIVQEQLFTNLAYRYDISNIPIYLAAKGVFAQSCKYAFTVDAGIGANFIITQHYLDWSIDGGVTQPDNAFNNHTQATFSAMLGVGVAMTNVWRTNAVECGYRLFYLGRGHLSKRTDQLGTSLSTGTNYANALVCSVSL